MQKIENNSAGVPLPASENVVAPFNNYEPVRFNAMEHGILSELVVLAHEDHAEFDDLLAGKGMLGYGRTAGADESLADILGLEPVYGLGWDG